MVKSKERFPTPTKQSPNAPLHREELATLDRIEAEIRKGIIKYYETGLLLQHIQSEKLYRYRCCKSFSEYCVKTFDFSRSYGYRLIAYCNVWNLLKDDAKDKIPERVIRELAIVKDETVRQKIWDKARSNLAAGEMPTHKGVAEIAHLERKQAQLEKAGFDPDAMPDAVFCHSLKTSIDKNNIANELIAKSDSKYRTLLQAAKELRALLEEESWEQVKAELLKRHEEFLDDLYEDNDPAEK